jgi:peptide-methionine (S)-S-oxide reductase
MLNRILIWMRVTLFSWLMFGIQTGFALEKDGQANKMDGNVAVFAMGCFWCGESDFRDHDNPLKTLEGIIDVTPGYAGGTEPSPTYENHPGYKEAVKVVFDPSKISYEDLLKIFWDNVDPLDKDGQFCDKGFPYTSAIFYENEQQRDAAIASRDALQKELKQIINTEIIPYTNFFDAEEYHKNYKAKNPMRYKLYRWNCGRDKRLEALRELRHNDSKTNP